MLHHLRNVAACIGWSLASTALAFGILFAIATALSARDLGQWETSDPEIRKWYESLRQPDNPTISCCGEADAYYADSYEVSGGQYVAIITDERTVPGRVPRPVGTRVLIPQHKLKFDQGNPTGHGIVFIMPGSSNEAPHVYCFLAPGGV